MSSETSPQRRYRLIAEIGRGGMAEIYLAVAQGPAGFNKLVVIKKALRDLALQPDFLAMFMDEARLAARMNHPNVVQTYEFGEEDGRQFIAMEHLDGQPYSRVLARLRDRTGSLEGMPLAHHLRILIDTLAGLHHAHELKDFDGTALHIVHRDVTPQNVFITYDGSIKVVDFGIAKAQDSSSRTVTGEIKGKVTYMSPEQVRGEPLDRRSDLFAVGVMLWEAVAGRRMWNNLPDMTVVSELVHGRVPAILAAAPHVPPELERILARALDPDRERRYPSALAMQRDLEELAVTSGARADGPEVGRAVSEWFEEQRQRVRAVVEAQLGSLRWTGENPSASNLPRIPAPPTSVSGREWLGPDERRPEGAMPGGSSPGLPTNSGASLPLRVMPVPVRRAWVMPLIAVALAAVLGSALVVGLVFMRAPVRVPSSASVAAAPSAPATTAAASIKPESVSLKVHATPADAKITMDGVFLGVGSFDEKVLTGDGPRVIRVEAEGYKPKEERVTLRSDLIMGFALEKLESAPASTASAAAPSASTSAVAPSATAKGPFTASKPIGPRPPPPPGGRGIDSASPYNHP